jgi:hypothetical protein
LAPKFDILFKKRKIHSKSHIQIAFPWITKERSLCNIGKDRELLVLLDFAPKGGSILPSVPMEGSLSVPLSDPSGQIIKAVTGGIHPNLEFFQ